MTAVADEPLLSASIELIARPKLNLTLRVIGVRPDGYHDIEALTVPISEPHDRIRLALVAGPPGISLVQHGANDIVADETNLAWRAAAEMLREVSARFVVEHHVQIELWKKIPAGAGLGGGSADAAAVLIGLRELLGVAINDADLARVGARLGSDVPFCCGTGAAVMRGRGELLDPIGVAVPAVPVTIVTPSFPCATPAVYREWDRGEDRAIEALAPPGLGSLTPIVVNDLTSAALRVAPSLGALHSLLNQNGRTLLLCGSGSSWAIFGPSPTSEELVRVRDAVGIVTVTHAETTDHCVTVVR